MVRLFEGRMWWPQRALVDGDLRFRPSSPLSRRRLLPSFSMSTCSLEGDGELERLESTLASRDSLSIASLAGAEGRGEHLQFDSELRLHEMAWASHLSLQDTSGDSWNGGIHSDYYASIALNYWFPGE